MTAPQNKTLVALASVGQSSTYAEMQQATGFDVPLLCSYMAVLKGRGLVERTNPTAPHGEPAVWRITSKGVDALNPDDQILAPGETTISRAIRVRPLLATVWSPSA